MFKNCSIFCLFFMLVFILNCSEESKKFALNTPTVQPSIKMIFPTQEEKEEPEAAIKNVKINTSIVLKCNKYIDKNTFDESMISVSWADGKLEGTPILKNDTIIFIPLDNVFMKPQTFYTVNVNNLVDIDGLAIDPFIATFTTGEKYDLERPYIENIKCHIDKIDFFFNEPLMPHIILDDAIDLRDNNLDIITGNIKYNEYENKITFFPKYHLNNKTKYLIKVLNNKGIKDLAGNEYQTRDTTPYEFYPEPIEDNEPPYIEHVQNNIGYQSVTIFFSERINCYQLNKSQFNKEEKFIIVEPEYAMQYYRKGIITRPQSGRWWESLNCSVYLYEEHNAITISFENEELTVGDNIGIFINTDAYIDLKGNKLYNKDNFFDEGPGKIRVYWTVPFPGNTL